MGPGAYRAVGPRARVWPVTPGGEPIAEPFDRRVEDDELDLREYLAVLRRRRGVIALAVAVVVASAVAVSLLQTPVYEGEAEVLLQPRASEQVFAPETQRFADRSRVQTEIEVMRSRSVREVVAGELGLEDVDELEVTVSAVGETDVVRVRAEHVEPERAAEVANTYVDTFVELRRRHQTEDLVATAAQVEARIEELGEQIAELDVAIAAEQAGPDAPGRRQALQAQQAHYLQQLDQLDLAGRLIQTGGAQVVSRAQVSESPVRPTPLRNAALAVVVGLILGVGLAFVREHLDDTVKNHDDLERTTGKTVVGLVPAVAEWRNPERAHAVVRTDPSSPAAEAYRALRTSVEFLGLTKPLRTLLVTSASASEGKSTTIANLALALARSGKRVAVVCCDLRRPRIHDFFELTNGIGLTSVLLGDKPLGVALQPVPGEGRLWLLASGPLPPNPAELLGSPRVAELLSAIGEQVDLVLVDTPPVLPVTDAAVAARLVDGVLLVASAGKTSRRDAERATEVLAQVGAPLLGAVLNGVATESAYGYRSGYGYYSADWVGHTHRNGDARRSTWRSRLTPSGRS